MFAELERTFAVLARVLDVPLRFADEGHQEKHLGIVPRLLDQRLERFFSSSRMPLMNRLPRFADGVDPLG